MLGHFFYLILLSSLTSCALFKSHQVQDQNIEGLINSLRAEGEGRGRLGINQNQYLFSYEAVLKENHDWILAADIPLHGEEVLLLSDLSKETVTNSQALSLEVRIEKEIEHYLRSREESPEMAHQFIQELRSLMRLVLHTKLGEKVTCSSVGAISECKLGKNTYQAEVAKNQLVVKKNVSDEHRVELVGENLTDSFFKRTNIYLHSQKAAVGSRPLLSLELFWK